MQRENRWLCPHHVPNLQRHEQRRQEMRVVRVLVRPFEVRRRWTAPMSWGSSMVQPVRTARQLAAEQMLTSVGATKANLNHPAPLFSSGRDE